MKYAALTVAFLTLLTASTAFAPIAPRTAAQAPTAFPTWTPFGAPATTPTATTTTTPAIKPSVTPEPGHVVLMAIVMSNEAGSGE